MAEVISQRIGIPFVKTSTSEVFRQHGLDPSEPLDFKKRLWIQHEILDAAEKVWQTEQRQFVTDRTPLDMAAYTLADIRGFTELNFAELEGYLNRCFQVTNKLFQLIVLVQPGIPLVYERGKASLNEGYLEDLNFLVLGLCNDDRIEGTFLHIHREMIDLENRVKTILEAVDKVRAYVKPN